MLKLCNIQPLPVQAGCSLYSVCSKCTDIRLDRCDQKVSGVCELYRVERGAVLFCSARGSTVCFTLDKKLREPRRCLGTNAQKISASHQNMNPVYRLNRKAYLQFICRPRNDQVAS